MQNSKVLRVQGIAIAYQFSAVLRRTDFLQLLNKQPGPYSPPLVPVSQSGSQQINFKPYTRGFSKSVCFMWHLFCLRNLENPKQYSESIFAQWLKTNATFTVHGKTLEGWTKEQKFYLMPVVWVLDFLSAMPDFILLMLLMLIHCPPFIVMSIFLNGDKKIWLTLILSATFFGLVLGEFSWIRDFRGLTQYSKLLWGDWTRLVEPGKRLIVADKGFLGMVDDGAEKGDMLFYLVGCSQPVVLREVQGDGDGGRDRRRYEAVRKCYIHFTKKDQEEYLGPKAPRSPGTASGRLRYERLKEEWVTELKKKGV